MTISEFMSDYWEKQPLVIRRDDSQYYEHLLTLADIDSILTNASLNDSDLRLVADGQETPISELIPDTVEARINGLEVLYARYRSGATVNLMFLHERWPPLTALSQRLATELSAGIHGNVYLTPPGSRGLTPHHDTHDVFVMQLYGTKNWTLHPTQTQLPLLGQGYALPPDGAGEPTHDFVLQPGDLAYLPRGTVHAARANDVASLHLTIGINPMIWAHVVRTAVESVLEKDIRFREALPPGFVMHEELHEAAVVRLHELLDLLRSQVRVPEIIDHAVGRMLQRRHPALAGHLLDLEALPSVDLNTRLRRRPELQWLLSTDDDNVYLEFHGKTVTMPAYVAEELSFMIKSEEFTGSDIPGSLDDQGRLIMIQQMLREGFLTRA